ncbi:serum response factor blistered [Lycorma delicatula]|uniref:serum response factor blistered n=1 Tax=Lycorma delicatula TaxID=130591 RepID=UPI003F519685
MDNPSGGGRDSRFSMGYNMSLLSGETTPEIYTSGVHSRPSTSITSGLSRSSLSLSSACGAGLQRGMKRTSSDVCFDQDVQGNRSNMSGMTGECGSDVGDDGFSPATQKGSPPSNGKKTKGRVKIKMEYIDNKLRRYTTFSKRKTGIMKKAYELSTLTGTQVMLLVASETGHVYTFATRKLQPMITSEAGKALIQTCLNSPDPCPAGSSGDQRMSATGFEETELSYNIGDEEQKEEMCVCVSPDALSGNESSSSESPAPPSSDNVSSPTGRGELSLLQQQLRQATSSPRSSERPPRSPPPAPAHQNTRPAAVGGLVSSAGFPRGLMYQTPQGMVYATPSPGLPNGGVIFSLGAEAGARAGGPQFITIPLPLGLATNNSASSSSSSSSSSSGPADLSKTKK